MDFLHRMANEWISVFYSNFSLLQLSDYVKTLANDIYLDKFAVTDQLTLPDPYSLKGIIGYPDMYNYFVDGVSLYTKKEFKNYKSLEGCEYFFPETCSASLFS